MAVMMEAPNPNPNPNPNLKIAVMMEASKYTDK